ncbi:MAG: toxin-antitoxin system YwqK family antitoxin [Saprospiraceae bacterium]|nr:toxin-antitoxin system YwqK family antitoxin [Saprospiraceae bacterium]
MKKFGILILLISSFIACKNNVHELINENGLITLRITGESGDTSKPWNGFYEKFDSQGVIYESAHYKNHQLNGERTIYENGFLYAIETYENNQFQGPYRLYFPNGKIKLEAKYENNIMKGELKSFYEDGSLKEIVQMAENEENGPFKEFYHNGLLKAEGSYKNGPNEHGELKLYDSTGVHIKTMICEDGICHTQWSKE